MVRFASIFVLVWTTVLVHSSSGTVVDAAFKDVPVALEPSGVGLRGSEAALSNEAVQNTIGHDLDRRLGTLQDGTSCWLGSSCNNCVNSATWWYSVGWTACGTEPCLTTGKPCQPWTTCGKCCNSDYNYNQDGYYCY